MNPEDFAVPPTPWTPPLLPRTYSPFPDIFSCLLTVPGTNRPPLSTFERLGSPLFYAHNDLPPAHRPLSRSNYTFPSAFDTFFTRSPPLELSLLYSNRPRPLPDPDFFAPSVSAFRATVCWSYFLAAEPLAAQSPRRPPAVAERFVMRRPSLPT